MVEVEEENMMRTQDMTGGRMWNIMITDIFFFNDTATTEIYT